MTSVADVIAVLERAYPSALAESWDRVGLVCGDPVEAVTRVRFTVDVTEEVVAEAISDGVELIVAHHPLFLGGIETVGTHDPKGSLIHRLIRAGCALYTAHTNADSAWPGVSDALADAIGVTPERPLAPVEATALDKWVVMVPADSADALSDAMFAAGAGRLGEYARCSWQTAGTGQFLPLEGAQPAIGARGDLEKVAEQRVEMVAARALRGQVLEALRAAHPYEEPAFDVFENATLPSDQGIGRIGRLREPMTLRAFAEQVGRGLPATATGVRVAGDLEQVVRTVAVCGGAGDSYLDAVKAAGVDVYLTADLRHHRVDEHLRVGGPAVVDVAHWASEFPWCAQAAHIVESAFSAQLACSVSTVRTDPWVFRAG